MQYQTRNEEFYDDPPVKACDDRPTKEQTLEKQRKERLVKQLGKKQSRWR